MESETLGWKRLKLRLHHISLLLWEHECVCVSERNTGLNIKDPPDRQHGDLCSAFTFVSFKANKKTNEPDKTERVVSQRWFLLTLSFTRLGETARRFCAFPPSNKSSSVGRLTFWQGSKIVINSATDQMAICWYYARAFIKLICMHDD